MFTRAAALMIDEGQKQQLESWARTGTTPQRVARRCRVILLASQGVSNHAIARQTGLSRPTVLATRAAFSRGGCEALRQPRKRQRLGPGLASELEQKILDTTLKARPPDATHWSVRELARHLRVSRMRVHRVWQRYDVQPHRVEKFKLSNDPLRRRSATWWDFISILRTALWCFAWMKKAKSRPWIEPPPCCPCDRACRNGRRTTTNGTARPRCSPPLTS